jgi:4-hydroxy-2-oxoheptanedioate aldolase
MLLIETLTALENIDAICRVDGIDCMIAPFDLSTELGVSGRFDAPEFREAVAKLERVIQGGRDSAGQRSPYAGADACHA